MKIARLPFFRDIKWNPNVSELRHFALAMLAGFAIIGLFFAWRMGGFGNKTFIIWGVGVFLAVTALIPRVGRLAYLSVYIPTSIMGYIVSHIILTVIFFLIVLPIAFLLRLMKKDLLRLKPEGQRAVWLEIKKDKSKDNYYRQF